MRTCKLILSLTLVTWRTIAALSIVPVYPPASATPSCRHLSDTCSNRSKPRIRCFGWVLRTRTSKLRRSQRRHISCSTHEQCRNGEPIRTVCLFGVDQHSTPRRQCSSKILDDFGVHYPFVSLRASAAILQQKQTTVSKIFVDRQDSGHIISHPLLLWFSAEQRSTRPLCLATELVLAYVTHFICRPANTRRFAMVFMVRWSTGK